MSFRDFLSQQGFIFGGGTGDTYEDLQHKRQMADALMGGRTRAPQTFGEGLSALGQALAERRLRGQVRQGEAKGREDFQSAFSRLIGGQAAPQTAQTPQPSTTARHSARLTRSNAGASGGGGFQGSQAEFIEAMLPHAMRASERTGVDPRIIIAQSAQETGWGKHAPGNNYFGIKSHGRSGGGTYSTTEYVNGQKVQINDSFRGYDDMGASVDGYATFLTENPRYRPMMAAQGLDAQLAELQKSGYATDPNYSRSVGQIARQISIPQGGSAGQPGVNPELIELASNPYATEGQKALMQLMLQKQMAASQPADPMQAMQLEQARLGLEKSQIELDRMRDPQPGYAILTDDEAAELGLPAGYAWQRDENGKITQVAGSGQETGYIVTGEAAAKLRLDPNGHYNITSGPNGMQATRIGGGGTNVTVNNAGNEAGPQIGTIPQGYAAVVDPSDPSGYRMEAIPGGPKDTSGQDAIAQANRERSGDVVIEDIDRVLGMMDDGGLPTTGIVGSTLSRVPGTDAHNTAKLLDTIKANVGFDRLQQMRDASPTGGALGAVSENEMRLLNSALGSLEQSQSAEQFRHNLTRLRQIYTEIVHGPEAQSAPEPEWTDLGGGVRIRTAPGQ